MRIAIVAHTGSPLTPSRDPHADARAAGVTSLAQTLAADGHRVTIYARRDAHNLPDHAILSRGVTIEHLTAGPAAPLRADEMMAHIKDFGDKLAKRWTQKCPDIAHAQTWTSGLATLVAARGKQVRVVQSFDSLASTERRHRVAGSGPAARAKLEGCLARSADCVLARTSAEVADLVRMGVPRASITVVPAGVDTALFSPDGPRAERTERPRLLAVSPLDPGQGLDQLVRILVAIPDAELVIAGGPPSSTLRTDKTYRELMRLARSLKVQRRLSFTGQIGHGELPSLLRSADVLVSAAPYEPLGAVTIAAMACGTPAAVTAVGGNRDAVLDETTGLLVAPGRIDLLARRVRRLLAAPMRLEAFGVAAADRAGARYAADRIGREALAAYQRLLAPTQVTVPAQAGVAEAEAAEEMLDRSEGLALAPVPALA
ncbi:MAG TPA: glycosyltransferase [Streptosporangiaceae bacterium]|jgi:glycosyltransferase involved in cell wall biosynthesis|nr:glycosyltransferase [Streptosporangiaceae bacterium]